MKLALFIFTSFLILASEFLILPSEALAADTTAPLTQATLDPLQPDGDNGWYKSPLEITLSAGDDSSGVQSIKWKLDEANWKSKTFTDSLNLAPNPSFEIISGGQPTDWQFSGLPSSTGSSDATTSVFGSRSLRIESIENGWSGFDNRLAYVPASPFANLTASVWVKTLDVSGQGAHFKVFALTPGGALEIAASASLTGTNDFTRISRTFSVSANDAYGIYLDLGILGIGTAWFDGVEIKNSATDTEVVNTFSSPGSHELEYYAEDNAGNSENPNKEINFKIDSTAPAPWKGFKTEREGNDHTLKAQIKVEDKISHPDGSTVAFQYSVDGGQNWGYYSDLKSCSSSWVADGWSTAVETGSGDGGNTLEIKTEPVDYCSSNWEICKILVFKVKDLAGNESRREICINGEWVKFSGDVGSNFGIDFKTVGTDNSTDGLVISKGSISNFTSTQGWLVENYPSPTLKKYADWLASFPTVASLPSGKLPKVSGRYASSRSFTISSTTIPSGFSASRFAAVVFINGDLTIQEDFSLAPGAALLFVVSGNVLVEKSVSKISGSFLIDGDFDSSYNGNAKKKLQIFGSLLATTFEFNRALGGSPNTDPAEELIYQVSFLVSLPSQFGDAAITWRQVSP